MLENPQTNQLNDRQAISFEIHEEPMDNQLEDRHPITARFGTWSNSAHRSHFSLSLFLIGYVIIFLFERHFR